MEVQDLELKLLSISEAAKILGIGRDTLKNLIAAGDIGFIKIGRHKRIPYRELSRFIDENTLRKISDTDRRLSENELSAIFELRHKNNSLNGGDIIDEILKGKKHGNINKKR